MKKYLVITTCLLFLAFPLVTNAYIIGDVDLKVNWTSPTGYETIYTHTANWYLDYDVKINGGPEIQAFCVENADASSLTQKYTLLSIDGSLADFGLDPKAYLTAAYIAEHYYNNASEAVRAAAQVAIWEIIFDNLDINLDSGKLIANTYKTDAQNILNSLQGVNIATYNSSWALAVSPTVKQGETISQTIYQNYLVPYSVPEPDTLLLLGSGLVGLTLALRRRNK